MIKAYTGMPGGGKTFALTHEAYKAMKKGRQVYSNYYIKGAYKLKFEDLYTYTFPEKSLLIIDEAGRYFNSRNWEKLNDGIFTLATQHRHLKIDLILGVQNFARIDKSIREVCELTYWARNIPFFPFFIHDGFYDLEKIGFMKKPDKVKYVFKSRKIRKMYDTYGMKSSFNDMDFIPKEKWQSTGKEIPTIRERVKEYVKANWKKR